MPRTRCPGCGASIETEGRLEVGARLTCGACGEDWIVSTVQPLRLEDELEGHIGDPDHSVRSRMRGPFRVDL